MNKKAQGLSINVIIIVAIALIVLVVLIAIFTGRLGGFTSSVDSATTNCVQTCKAAGYSGGSTYNDACSGDKVGNCCCTGIGGVETPPGVGS